MSLRLNIVTWKSELAAAKKAEEIAIRNRMREEEETAQKAFEEISPKIEKEIKTTILEYAGKTVILYRPTSTRLDRLTTEKIKRWLVSEGLVVKEQAIEYQIDDNRIRLEITWEKI